MFINNFSLIESKLSWNENKDEFYFAQILKRKKEHKELGSNSYVVKTYYIKDQHDMDLYRGEMIALANFHDARVYINLNKRSFERTAFQCLKKITDQIMNKDYSNVRKAYNSVIGEYSHDSDKKWIIDIDGTNIVSPIMMANIDHKCEPIEPKCLFTVPTKNGVHLITKPFNLQTFRQLYPDVEVHKNNPTILYVP